MLHAFLHWKPVRGVPLGSVGDGIFAPVSPGAPIFPFFPSLKALGLLDDVFGRNALATAQNLVARAYVERTVLWRCLDRNHACNTVVGGLKPELVPSPAGWRERLRDMVKPVRVVPALVRIGRWMLMYERVSSHD